METKWCGHGEHEVAITNFHKKGNYLQPNCRDCQNALNRQRYKKNRKTHIRHVIKNKRERVLRFRNWKKSLHCQICNETYWQCLDFHHTDPSKKDIGISESVAEVSFKRLVEELEKCVVLCKNCHTKVHGGIIVLPTNIEGCIAKFGVAPDS